MRISDWSSDVCSSDLVTDQSGRSLQNQSNFPLKFHIDRAPPLVKFAADFGILEAGEGGVLPVTVRGVEASLVQSNLKMPATALKVGDDDAAIARWLRRVDDADRSEERPVGKEGVRTVRSRRSHGA